MFIATAQHLAEPAQTNPAHTKPGPDDDYNTISTHAPLERSLKAHPSSHAIDSFMHSSTANASPTPKTDQIRPTKTPPPLLSFTCLLTENVRVPSQHSTPRRNPLLHSVPASPPPSPGVDRAHEKSVHDLSHQRSAVRRERKQKKNPSARHHQSLSFLARGFLFSSSLGLSVFGGRWSVHRARTGSLVSIPLRSGLALPVRFAFESVALAGRLADRHE